MYDTFYSCTFAVSFPGSLPEWGVTVLQADEEMDAGDVWSSNNFSVPHASSLTKSAFYNKVRTYATGRQARLVISVTITCMVYCGRDLCTSRSSFFPSNKPCFCFVFVLNLVSRVYRSYDNIPAGRRWPSRLIIRSKYQNLKYSAVRPGGDQGSPGCS